MNTNSPRVHRITDTTDAYSVIESVGRPLSFAAWQHRVDWLVRRHTALPRVGVLAYAALVLPALLATYAMLWVLSHPARLSRALLIAIPTVGLISVARHFL